MGNLCFNGSMPIVDPLLVSAVLADIAAEIILPRYTHLAEGDVREKHPGDLVTVADVEAEAALSRRLGALVAGSQVVGEEAASADAGVLDRLRDEGPVWILDPIDGTSNFVKGSKAFAIIVALVSKGRTVQGWIHVPLSGQTVIAEEGAGTWRGDTRLRIAPPGPLAAMSGSAGYRRLGGLAQAVGRLVSQGSAAHDYLHLLDNRLQFAYFRRLHPWDHAAGVLLHREAGGYNAMMNGEAYRPLPSNEGILLAPDEGSWEQLRQRIGLPAGG